MSRKAKMLKPFKFPKRLRASVVERLSRASAHHDALILFTYGKIKKRAFLEAISINLRPSFTKKLFKGVLLHIEDIPSILELRGRISFVLEAFKGVKAIVALYPEIDALSALDALNGGLNQEGPITILEGDGFKESFLQVKQGVSNKEELFRYISFLGFKHGIDTVGAYVYSEGGESIGNLFELSLDGVHGSMGRLIKEDFVDAELFKPLYEAAAKETILGISDMSFVPAEIRNYLIRGGAKSAIFKALKDRSGRLGLLYLTGRGQIENIDKEWSESIEDMAIESIVYLKSYRASLSALENAFRSTLRKDEVALEYNTALNKLIYTHGNLRSLDVSSIDETFFMGHEPNMLIKELSPAPLTRRIVKGPINGTEYVILSDIRTDTSLIDLKLNVLNKKAFELDLLDLIWAEASGLLLSFRAENLETILSVVQGSSITTVMKAMLRTFESVSTSASLYRYDEQTFVFMLHTDDRWKAYELADRIAESLHTAIPLKEKTFTPIIDYVLLDYSTEVNTLFAFESLNRTMFRKAVEQGAGRILEIGKEENSPLARHVDYVDEAVRDYLISEKPLVRFESKGSSFIVKPIVKGRKKDTIVHEDVKASIERMGRMNDYIKALALGLFKRDPDGTDYVIEVPHEMLTDFFRNELRRKADQNHFDFDKLTIRAI